jgi:hypothetical protein
MISFMDTKEGGPGRAAGTMIDFFHVCGKLPGVAMDDITHGRAVDATEELRKGNKVI